MKQTEDEIRALISHAFLSRNVFVGVGEKTLISSILNALLFYVYAAMVLNLYFHSNLHFFLLL